MKAKKKIPQETIREMMKNVKVTYTVETVYSCIKKGDTLEIEDNREKIRERLEEQQKLIENARKLNKQGGGSRKPQQ